MPMGTRLQRMTILIYRTIMVIAVILNSRILPYQAFPYSPILPTATETRKKPAITVSRKILEPKGLTFENRNKTICFLSVFSVVIYIFEETTNAIK